jgi:hypothetical protein
MKIGCHCGNTLFDQTDGLPNKAYLIPDQGWDAMWEAIEEEVVSAVAAGLIKPADAAWKARLLVNAAGKRMMWQCSGCGRLYIDDRHGNLQCFLPSTADTEKEILRGRDHQE